MERINSVATLMFKADNQHMNVAGDDTEQSKQINDRWQQTEHKHVHERIIGMSVLEVIY